MLRACLLMLLSLFLLSACNTVEGLGKDIEKSAQWTRGHLPD